MFGLRRLRYAVAASLALHLLLLWPPVQRPADAEPPAPLQASLRLPPVPPPASALPLPAAKPVPAMAPVPVPARTPVSAPEAVAVQVPMVAKVDPEPVMTAAARPAEPRVEAVADASPVAVPATASPPAAATPAVAAAAAPRRASAAAASATTPEVADGLRGYRIAVAREARRFKRYPPQASTSGWEGSAEIALQVDADGRPRPATLARSSGHEPLDRAALAMIDAGAQRAHLPDALRGRSFAVRLPVVFDLAGQ